MRRMAGFHAFDTRGYRTVDARRGYGEWAPTYEQTVEDAMDIDLLEALQGSAGRTSATRRISAAAPGGPAPGCGRTASPRWTAST